MTQRTPIPCPECAREKYFEGLCYACNSRKLRLYYELMPQEQVAATIANIIDQIETIEDWDKVYKDFIGLLAYQDINTKEIAKTAFEKNIFHPPTLYRNASDEIQDQHKCFFAKATDFSLIQRKHLVLFCFQLSKDN